MIYTISEIAEKMGVSVHTLRFYDKEGLLPHVERVNGRRVFHDEDFSWLRVLHCMKNTGMPLKEIRTYLELCEKGDVSLQERYQIILKQKEAIEEQICFLQHNLEEINYKVWYYQTAIAAGTEAIHAGKACNPSLEPEQIPQSAGAAVPGQTDEAYTQKG